MNEDYLCTVSIALCKMRLIAEGAMVVYENDAHEIVSLANEHQHYPAIQTLDMLYMAVLELLGQIEKLQIANMQALYHRTKPASE